MLRSTTTRNDLMIPQEILDYIIDIAAEEVGVNSDGEEDDEREKEYPPLNFQQVKLLRSISLVSQSCCLRARKHLFAQIRLTLPPCDDRYSHKVTPLHNLATVLQSNERLRTCPRLLELSIDRVSLEHAVLARILAWLPCLRMVRIGPHVGLDFFFDWQIIHEEVLKTLFDLRKTSPHVEILELCQFINLDIGFVLGWKVVRKLTLENCMFLQSDLKDDDCSLSTLRHLYLIGAAPFLDILAARHERAAPETSLQSLAIQIRSHEDANILWSFLSSSLAHALKTLKVHRLRALVGLVVAPPVALSLPSLTSLSLRITAFDAEQVQFPEFFALGNCQSQLETITLDIQFELDASMESPDDVGGGWDIGIAWDALDLALASTRFPCLKGVNARVEYVLDPNECFDQIYPKVVARDMADLLTEGELFPRLSSHSRKIDLKVTGTVRWSDE